MPKIIHLRPKCIGCAVCAEMQPELWCMSKNDGKATLVRATVKKDISILSIGAEVLEQTQVVIKACPVNIIKLS